MKNFFGIKIEATDLPGMLRAQERALKIAHYKAGQVWAETMLPKRFEEGSPGHADRAASTKKRKEKQGKNPKLALVDRGTSRDIAIHNFVIRAFKTRVSVNLPVGKFFTINPKPVRFKKNRSKGHSVMHPNLVKEVLYISPRDEQKLIDVFKVEYAAAMNHELERKTKVTL